MKRFFPLLCGILMAGGTVSGQSEIGLPKVILPSPTAMLFQKYGDYPVGNFTGVLSINIPLYTLKEGGLKIPVSMSYHASGIKVSDPNGFFGIGWTLNTGGVVSVTTREAPDDNFPTTFVSGADIDPCNTGTLPMFTDLETMEEQGDLEHDIFSYSFDSENGNFHAGSRYNSSLGNIPPGSYNIHVYCDVTAAVYKRQGAVLSFWEMIIGLTVSHSTPIAQRLKLPGKKYIFLLNSSIK